MSVVLKQSVAALLQDLSTLARSSAGDLRTLLTPREVALLRAIGEDAQQLAKTLLPSGTAPGAAPPRPAANHAAEGGNHAEGANTGAGHGADGPAAGGGMTVAGQRDAAPDWWREWRHLEAQAANLHALAAARSYAALQRRLLEAVALLARHAVALALAL